MKALQGSVTEQVCTSADLSTAARRLWQADISGTAYLKLLQQQDLPEDGLRLLPHLLPRREAIWWGCLCAWEMTRQHEQSSCREALKAACCWVSDPSEANRRAAQVPADAGNLTTASSCLAAAVCWSEIGAADAGARLVVAAVLLAAVERAPLHYAEHCRRFLAMGLQVANGLHGWDERTHTREASPHPPARRVPQAPHQRPEVVAVS